MATTLQVDSDRYFSRLAQLIPTVWVLIGQADAVLLEWRRIVEQRLLFFTVVHDNEMESLHKKWLRSWLNSNNLLAKSAEYAASLSKISIENTMEWMKGKSAEERRLFVENHFDHRQQNPVDILVQAVLLTWEELEAKPNNITQQLSFIDSVLDDSVQMVSAFFSLAPSTSPSLILISDDTLDAEYDLCILQMAKIALAVPALPLAWGVSQRRYEAFLQRVPECKEKTLCREMVSIISQSMNKEEPDLPNLSARQKEILASLKRGGSAPSLVEKFKATVRALQAPDHSETQGVERARSAAEAFLFERLESLPETSGLFHLNRKLAIDCVEWPILEIDLFCEPLRIAIEVDGYYHFQDREAYRRDRQKDYLMQRENCFVLRFHAEDIVECLEGILRSIVETIRLRKRQNMKV